MALALALACSGLPAVAQTVTPDLSLSLQSLHQQAASLYGRETARTIEVLRDLANRVEQARASVGPVDDDGRQLLARWSPDYKFLARMLVEQKRPDEAWRYVELAKGRALMDRVHIREAEESPQLPLEARRALSAAGDRLAKADVRLSVQAADPANSTQAAQERKQLMAELSTQLQELARRFPVASALMQPALPDQEALRQALPEDAIYLSLAYEPNLMLLFATTREGTLAGYLSAGEHWEHSTIALHKAISHREGVKGLKAEGTYIIPAAQGFRISMAEEDEANAITRLEPIADWFGEQLLRPLLERFPGKRRLIISPDGPLHFLPFEVMRVKGRWLVETFDVSYAASAASLLLSRERLLRYGRQRERLPLLAMGGGSYQPIKQISRSLAVDERLSQVSGEARQVVTQNGRIFLKPGGGVGVEQAYSNYKGNFSDLPASEQEVREVASLFPRSHVLLGKKATEQSLVDLEMSGDLARYRYLVMSAHGVVHPTDPWLSAIVLTQTGPSGQEDGFVTAGEWQRFHLRSDLTVLASCESGVGRVQRGEGVLGLTYALTLAGSANVAHTLWTVDDRATADFVIDFFRRLASGASQVSAMAQAKRDALAKHGAEKAYFWAPLVLYGW
ncbi:MAG: CHAT domain-containing protein [Betaproteobacteria bacterium]|nr:CHAT domain-containing protein [Betaproteobacteria bacterium]